jgi:GT2 family glycosyltransferase
VPGSKIAVIVVNYRTPSDLHRFIDSFREFAPANTNLIVVDVDPITPFGYRQVPGQYIIMQENRGYAYACNYAAAMIDSPYLAFFNADVVLKAGVLEDCTQALEDNPSWGVVGPLQYDTNGRITHAGVFGTHEKPVIRGWRSKNKEEFRDVRHAVTVFGSAYFVKRSVFEELAECPIFRASYPEAIGAFLPTFLYYEETWISYHAWAHGYDVVYYGLAECVHQWHGSIGAHTDKKCTADSRKAFREMCDAHDIPHD